MKKFWKAISMVMAVTMIVTAFASCQSDKGQTAVATAKNVSFADGEKIQKIDYYRLFIEQTNIYSTSSKSFDIDDENVLCQTMVDWSLLSEKTAFKDLEKNVTKEIVATSCANYISIRPNADIKSVKDIDKCEDKQAVADSVEMGLVTLDNGWFNANQTISKSECESIITSTINYQCDAHYEENSGTFNINFQDDVECLDANTINPNDIISISDDATSSINVSNMETPKITQLGYNGNNSIIATPVAENANKTVFIKGDYRKFFKEKQKVVYDNFYYIDGTIVGEALSGLKDKSFSGTITKVMYNSDNDTTTLFYLESNVEDIIKDIQNDNYNKKADRVLKKGNKKSLSIKIDGDSYNITTNVSDDGLEFAVKNDKSNVKFVVEKPTIDCNNAWGLFNKNGGKSNFKLTIPTTETFNYSDSKQYDKQLVASKSSAQSAKSKKIASLDIPIAYGFSIGMDVTLKISIDGSISIVATQKNCLEIKKNDGKITTSFNCNKDSTIDANVNLYVGLEFVPNVSWCKVSIIDITVEGGIKIDTTASLFTKTETGYSEGYSGYSNNKYKFSSLTSEISQDSLFAFCLNVNIYPVITYGAMSEKCAVGKLLKVLNIKSPSNKYTGEPFFKFHYEYDSKSQKGNRVEQCTRSDEVIVDNGLDHLQFDQTAVTIDYNNGETNAYLQLKAVPKDAKKLLIDGEKKKGSYSDVKFAEKNGKNKSEKFTSTTYNWDTNTIEIELMEKDVKKILEDESPTITITVYLKKKKDDKKYDRTDITVNILGKSSDSSKKTSTPTLFSGDWNIINDKQKEYVC